MFNSHIIISKILCKIPNRDIAYNDSISTYIFYLLYLDSSQYGRLIALYSAKRKLNLCRTSKFMGQTHIYNLHANFYLNWIIFHVASMCEYEWKLLKQSIPKDAHNCTRCDTECGWKFIIYFGKLICSSSHLQLSSQILMKHDPWPMLGMFDSLICDLSFSVWGKNLVFSGGFYYVFFIFFLLQQISIPIKLYRENPICVLKFGTR